MAVQCYNVPVVLPDLRREESLIQVTEALEYLEAVANDIFNRISNRVGVEREKLAAINTRICVAQAKVDKLRSATSKATTVFSPPKYPAPKQLEPYRSMFAEVDRRMKNVRHSRRPVESRIGEVNSEVISAKQNFDVFKQDINAGLMNVKLRHLKKTPVTEESEGLGGLPEYLPSVTSLLLFNTSDNPYRKYVYTDPLSGHVKKTTKDEIIEQQKTLGEAPASILTGEELGRYQGASDVTYRPKLDALPELEVPSVLNLPNIADDWLYNADQGPSIAPSLANTLDLPEIEPSAASDLPPAPSAEVNLPPISGDPPPPPPPPPTGPNIELPSLDLEAGVGLESEEQEPAMSAEDNPRADLMQAIRKAGGTKNAGLRKATERRMEKKKIKEEEDTVAVGSGGGDLMSDLRSALFRRRKGISGKQDKDEAETHDVGGGSMMNKVSAMIPSPGQVDNDDSGSGSDSAGHWEA